MTFVQPVKLTILAALTVIGGLLPTTQGFCVGQDKPGLEWLARTGTPQNSNIAVVVFLDDDPIRHLVAEASTQQRLTRDVRLRKVTRELQAYRPMHSWTVGDYLNRNSTTGVIRHWIVPAFTATLQPAQIETVSVMEGVKLVIPNIQLDYLPPVEVHSAATLSTAVSSQLGLIGVPGLWNRGITGQGRLVCSFDTGVEVGHPALSSKWRGNYVPLSAAWMSNVAPDALPSDRSGHGTHTMGIMVGSDGADTVGVAPDAEWITAGVIDQGKTLNATISDILQAFQWALNPDGDPSTTDDVPDVILNSWGIPAGLFGPCDDTFWGAIDNVEAAGIVTIFAAGNEGPDPQTIRNPADRASSSLNAFAVGAVDNSKQIAGFSSRGPASCNPDDIKPELVAPGVSIRSASREGGYVYMSGTSMAAPFIAGLVALARQYNPDATVEDIKWALIQSAEDLGPVGEDNSYGYGLVNALLFLDFLPVPGSPDFHIGCFTVLDDGVAFPGELCDLEVILTNSRSNVEQAVGRLKTDRTDVAIIKDTAAFYFGDGGSTAVNSEPYEVSFGSGLYHGQEVVFTLYVEDIFGHIYDSLQITMMVGYEPEGNMADHNAGSVEFSVSDFGQYGLAQASVYNINGKGFRFDNGDNLLYEAGIILGRNYLQLSSSVRGEDGRFVPSDFTPVETLSGELTDQNMGVHRRAKMADTYSDIAIPITIYQETIDYGGIDDNGFIVMKYFLFNTSLQRLTDLHFGFLADFDLPGDSNAITYDESQQFLYQSGDDGILVGLVNLAGMDVFKSLANDTLKTGFSRDEQFDLISSGTDIDDSLAGDLMFLVSAGPFNLEVADSVEVAFALIAGQDLDELYRNAAQARMNYSLPTGLDDIYTSLPDDFILCQNYPNPFNPTTTISFSLPRAGNIKLDVYNVLGQTVKQLYTGTLPAGQHSIEWDATNSGGDHVASGVYFYRLQTEEFTNSRKMVLLR